MDKEKKLLSRKLAKIRGWIQAAATLLTNIHISNLFKGKIYQGNAKTDRKSTRLNSSHDRQTRMPSSA